MDDFLIFTRGWWAELLWLAGGVLWIWAVVLLGRRWRDCGGLGYGWAVAVLLAARWLLLVVSWNAEQFFDTNWEGLGGCLIFLGYGLDGLTRLGMLIAMGVLAVKMWQRGKVYASS